MAGLQAICCDAGFVRVRTYIASGNVIFESPATPDIVKSELEKRLAAYAGKPIGVILRTASEMKAVLDANPFPEAAPNRTLVIFLEAAPPSDALSLATNIQGEDMRLGDREIYIHYGKGISDSKLKLPAAKAGTARNINTVAKLAELAANL
jgi:uncharacterized protein (DUF1697 family)